MAPKEAAAKLYGENSSFLILNPERIEYAQDNAAKEFVRIVEKRMEKMRREALQNGVETTGRIKPYI